MSQYLKADSLSCADEDLAYHVSKVQTEQLLAWFGLTKKIETRALRFGPLGKLFLGTGVSLRSAVAAIHLALRCESRLWYEPFSIVDRVPHIDTSRAQQILGFVPQSVDGLKYSNEPNGPSPHNLHQKLFTRY